jgi:hypothetical protein
MPTELEALKQRVAELEEAANQKPLPPRRPPVDYSDRLSMPRSAMAALIDNVPDKLMNDLRADARYNPVSASQAQLSKQQSSPAKRASGWVDERRIETPPGQKWIDTLVTHQDRLDCAELALRLARAGLSKGEV